MPSTQQLVNALLLRIRLICSVQCPFQQLQPASPLQGSTDLYLGTRGYLNSFAITHDLCRQVLNCIWLPPPGAQAWHHAEGSLLVWHTDSEYTVTQRGTHEKGRVSPLHIGLGPTSSSNFWALFGQLRAAPSLTLSRSNHGPSQYSIPQQLPNISQASWALKVTDLSFTDFTYIHLNC